MSAAATIIPFMRYVDAPAAIDFLVNAFGFEKAMVVPGESAGTIEHAELRLGTSTIMLGSLKDDRLGMKTPDEAGGVTQGIYVALDDVAAHYSRAVAAGAKIVDAIRDTDYGSREYLARDTEGHLWIFGTYHPEAPDEEGAR